MSSSYLAKYPFNGNPAQSQLSFPAGATIIARDGQDGKPWFWGNYMGKDGWFPPTYVTKIGSNTAPPAPAQSQVSMQQRMATASFTSSAAMKQQQQQQQQQQQKQQQYSMQPMKTSSSTGISGFGGTNPNLNLMTTSTSSAAPTMNNLGAAQNQSSSFGFSQLKPLSGFQAGIDDPFAELDAAPAPAPVPSLPSPSSSQMNTPSFGFGTLSASQTSTSSGGTVPAVNPFKSGSGFSMMTPSTTQPTVQQTQARIDQVLSKSNTTDSSFSNKGIMHTDTNLSSPFQSPIRASISADAPSAPAPAASSTISSMATSITGAISSAFTFTSETSTAGAPAEPPLKQDASQKQLIEEMLAKKKAEEEARIQKEKELEWERNMQLERERRLQEASESRTHKVQQVALPSPRSEGLGSSGSTLSALKPGSITSTAGIPILHPNGKMPFFDPYAFLSDARSEPIRKFNPIYRVQPFWALMNVDLYVKKLPPAPETQTIAAKYDQLAKALSFICHIVQENERLYAGASGMDAPLSFLKANQLGIEACIKLISALPHSAGASGKQLDTLFLTFISMFVTLVTKMQPHQQIVIPGGWQRPEGKGHVCLYILRNVGSEKFSFTVLNTGEGLQYHPSKFDQNSGLELKQMAMTIWDIPAHRLTDSSFWVLLFRMQVYPDKRNTAEVLYTKLLPGLNSRPLRSNLDLGPAEFLEVPDKISRANFHLMAKLALTTIPVDGARPSKFNSLLLMNSALDLAYEYIKDAPPGSMDPEDTRILKLSGRNLANYGSSLDPTIVTDGALGSALSTTWDLLDRLLQKINFASSKAMDQHSHGMSASALNDNFSQGVVSSLQVEPGLTSHPFFGRFRRDNYDEVVKKLMGEQRPDPILIPAVLTDESMPAVATDYQTASSSLQRLCHACSLLLHQRQLVKNAPAFVSSAAQYALTVTLPMPNLDPKYCFWRKNPMRRETQINLLFLIRRMCRIYSAATTCVQQSRGLVAIRTTAFACAACIADAISRVKCVDDPSLFALHYSGLCEGPTEPFGIEAGAFETLGANLPIFDAHYTSLRFLCLDYLRGISVKEDGSKRPTIFNFDQKMLPMEGDTLLIDQLSIELALPRPHPRTEKALISNACSLISGRNGCLLEVLPEMEYFRDIIFHFKHSVSGKAAAPSDVAEDYTWLPHHATLKWNTKPISSEDNTQMYKVHAFRGTEQEYVEVEVKETTTSAFKSFMRFFGKGKEERRRISAADPTNIVNSCGEKFLNKK